MLSRDAVSLLCVATYSLVMAGSRKDNVNRRYDQEVCSAVRSWQNIRTGYARDGVKSSVSKPCPFGHLDPTIEGLHSRLRCGYAFAALSHMHLCRFLLETTGKHDVHTFNANMGQVGLYHTLAVDTLATLYNVSVRPLPLEGMWYFLTYVDLSKRLHWCVDSVADLLRVHDSVAGLLREMTGKCDEKNEFNHEYEGWMVHGRPMQFKGRRNRSAVCSRIDRNIDAVEKLIDNNVRNGGMWTGNRKLFHLDALYLNGMAGKVITLFELYPEVNWKCFLDNLSTANYRAHSVTWLADRIQALGVYQTMVVDVLNMIMLRITWRCLLYVKRTVAIRQRGFPWLTTESEYRTVIVQDLFEFVSYTGAVGDTFFKQLLRCMEDLDVFSKKSVEKIITMIEQHLTEISSSFGYDATINEDLIDEIDCKQFAMDKGLSSQNQIVDNLHETDMICGCVFIEYQQRKQVSQNATVHRL